METALEVLSRAATMVTAISDNNNRLTITKELPTTKWRRDRRIRLSSEYHHNHDTISTVKPLGESNQSNQSMNNGSSDTMEIPLDMSVNATKQQQLPPPPYREPLPGSTFSTVTRPSVITQAPKREIISNQENKDCLSPKKSPILMCDDSAPATESISMVDPVIDEHFRRSLGADYMNLFGNHLNQLKSSRAAANQTTSNNNNNNNNKINNKSPQISPIAMKAATKPVIPISNKCSTENDESETGPATVGTVENIEFSVDDHFAKALGDTWTQLQQNKQTNSSPADSPSPNKMEIDQNAIIASEDEKEDEDEEEDEDEDDENDSDSHR